MENVWNKLKHMVREDKEEPEAVIIVRAAAERGDAGAQYRLGDMYYNGENIPQNYTTAAEWYRRSAVQGHAPAQFQIGNMYRVGLGVLQNAGEAAQWLQRAAEQGDPAAQALLGKLDGRNVPSASRARDFPEAVKRLQSAAEQGQAGARLLLGGMYATGNGVSRDRIIAFAWNELALAALEPGLLRDEALSRQRQLTATLSADDQARAQQFVADHSVAPRA
ncbi:MAG: sel1 repeat family protein [Verrucomicrobia bacterium]|nr:sel1 repeat family protein [Verrucomicrobiota bacterium]MCG2680853.1 sel1 repeat family protein [Kiritimatiellia bacterium]MBU4246863.1 sel1 repeat family protein [Verrucomicrobiota bacterium]MBU4290391.1 sel1 repeat family protein [Verrucomicrobiota bacterium]MBU4430242.1 sel1 repeat family protein [Verrucomicrobiota bacterium]